MNDRVIVTIIKSATWLFSIKRLFMLLPIFWKEVYVGIHSFTETNQNKLSRFKEKKVKNTIFLGYVLQREEVNPQTLERL